MGELRLTPRKIQILKAIVEAHIATGEPVGSRYLSEYAGITCSSATIRNEMADLEAMGYLTQPHTSAGRIPTELGYRLYVEALIHQYSITKAEIQEINEQLHYKLSEMGEILSEISRIAAQGTNYTGLALRTGASRATINRFMSVYLSPRDFMLVMSFKGDTVKSKTVHLSFAITEHTLSRFTDALNLCLTGLSVEEITIPLIVRIESLMGTAGAMVHPSIKVIYEAMSELDEADVRLDGITKLLQYPEYSEDVSRFRGLLGVLEEKTRLVDVIKRQSDAGDGIHVYIGAEDSSDAMSNTAVIFKNVTVGNSQFAVGVIGPKRMDYSRVISMINKLAYGIDRLLGDEGALPPGDEE